MFNPVKIFRSKRCKEWAKVLDIYTEYTEKYIKIFNGLYGENGASDAPYWHSERSNVGLLASACWRNGWIALEEFSTTKRKKDNSKKAGRCDLWVSSPKGAVNFAIEAKKGYCSLDSKNIINKLEHLLFDNYKKLSSHKNKSACGDAKKLNEWEADDRMGIVFIHFYLTKSKKDKAASIVKQVADTINSYYQSGNIDFIYLYLKDNGVEGDNGSIIPGVLIAGKIIDA